MARPINIGFNMTVFKKTIFLVTILCFSSCNANVLNTQSLDISTSKLSSATSVPSDIEKSKTQYSDSTKESLDSSYLISSNENTASSYPSSLSDACEEEPKEDWRIQIEERVEQLNEFREQSLENETFCFYTDPHCFSPTGDYSFDKEALDYAFNILETAEEMSNSLFVVCGGDVLNNNDTKSQACYKLGYYNALMKQCFKKSFYLVGNHDTNYQGDTYINSRDYNSCMLSQETINDILYDGSKSYYRIDSDISSYYCFDSGIELTNTITPYQKEQVEWFARSLLLETKLHINIFIHISFLYGNVKEGLLMSDISRVVSGYNSKMLFNIYGKTYDYRYANGNIHFVNSGHDHRDVNGFSSSGIPIFLTRTFSSPEIATQPTFDLVFVDYSNARIVLLRIGDGDNREFSIPFC